MTERIIFLAMTAVAVSFIQARLADVNPLSILIKNASDIFTIATAIVASLASFGVAVLTVKIRRNLRATANTQAISTDIKCLEVVYVILVN